MRTATAPSPFVRYNFAAPLHSHHLMNRAPTKPTDLACIGPKRYHNTEFAVALRIPPATSGCFMSDGSGTAVSSLNCNSGNQRMRVLYPGGLQRTGRTRLISLSYPLTSRYVSDVRRRGIRGLYRNGRGHSWHFGAECSYAVMCWAT